jgi:hypothetical protein
MTDPEQRARLEASADPEWRALLAEIEQHTVEVLFPLGDGSYGSATALGTGRGGAFVMLADALSKSWVDLLVRRGDRTVDAELNAYDQKDPVCLLGSFSQLLVPCPHGRPSRSLEADERLVAVQRRGLETVAWRGRYCETVPPDESCAFPFLIVRFPIPGPPLGAPVFDRDAAHVGWTACHPADDTELTSVVPDDWRCYSS